MIVDRSTILAAVTLLVVWATACSSGESTSSPAQTTGNAVTKPESERQPLTTGVANDIAEFNELSLADNTRTGFDHRVATWLAANTDPGFEPVWVPITTGERVDALVKGRVTLVVDVFSITDSKREKIGMAGPYLVTRQSFLAKQDFSITSQNDLAGRSICTLPGTTSDLGLQELKHTVNFRIDYENSNSACVDRVQRGDTQVFSTDQLILSGFASASKGSLSVSPYTFGGTEEYGVGFRRGDIRMCNMLRKGIADMIRNGEWDIFFNLHFPNLDNDSGYRPDPERLDPC